MKPTKFISALLALVMSFSLVSCAKPTEGTAPETTESTTPGVTSSTGTTVTMGDQEKDAEDANDSEWYDEPLYTLKYCHMNTETDDSGVMATAFADRVEELTKGAVTIEIFPNSTVGSIQEQAEMVSAGTMDINHSTWGGISPLCTTVEVMDTPYLASSLDDAQKLFNVQESPIIAKMNELLIAEANVRVIGAAYGGSRMLTANIPVYSPTDLDGVKIRAIPSQVYMTAVEGMGAIAVAVDWADVPTALATGVAAGQENPPGTTYNANLQESQDYIMETRHIMGFGPLIINETSLNNLPQEYQDAVLQAAKERDDAFFEMSSANDDKYIQLLEDAGMTYISVEDGLDVDAFTTSVGAKVAENFPQYADYYAEISQYLGYN